MNAIESRNALYAFGFSLLFLGMSVGSLARTLHVSDTVSMAMSTTSGLLSIGAIVLFVKAAKDRRAAVLTFLVVAVAIAALTLLAFHVR